MDANFGGTELAAAMEHALQGRNHSISTVVFVLTDGEVMHFKPCSRRHVHNEIL